MLLMDNVEDLQRGIDSLNVPCEEFGMNISVGKTKVMHVGKTKQEVVCSLNNERLGEVSEFTYLGTIFSEDGNLLKELEGRRRKGNAVASQLRSHVFNKK